MLHLDSLYIKNFRIFKELKIKTLGRVNLFTGKNNSGKSCLLEAIECYATKFENIHELILNRDEHWEIEKNSDKFFKSPFKYLFNNNNFLTVDISYLDTLFVEQAVPFETINDKNRLDKIIEISTNEENKLELSIHIHKDKINEFRNFEYGSVALIIKFNNIEIGLIPINFDLKGMDIEHRNIESVISSFKNKINIQKISALNATTNIPKLWDNISLTDNEKEVITGLKILENKISTVTIKGKGMPVVRCEEEILPLKHFGDGMIRIFNIILALVNAQNGILLIDEVENGLHWSAHSKLWQVIFELSEKLNVQVFATTHSLDSVRGFSQIWKEKQDKGTFYRLEKDIKTDDIKAVYYDCEDLSDTLEVNVEFR